jgi:hypothetical protein
VRVALLLTVIGEESVELFETFEWSDPANKEEILPVLDKFEAYCKPKASELFETYRFLSRKQEQGEPIDAYVTALRTLSEGCGFADKERRIRDQVVLGIRDDRVRERLLRDTKPTLDRVMETIRAKEMAEHQLKTIVGDGEDPKVNKVFKANHMEKRPKKQYNGTEIDCKFCGHEHERNKESCPAWGKECRKCSRKNHFASKCLAKKGSSSSSPIGEVSAFAITGKDKITKTLTVKPSGLKVTFLIDTGASINILPITEYIRLTGDKEGSRLDKTSTTTIRTYGGKTWTSQGRTELAMVVGTNVHKIPIIVANVNAMPLLSLNTSEALGLVHIMDCDGGTTASRLQGQISDARSRPSHVQKVRIGQGINGLTKDDMLQRYADVYEGLDELEEDYHIKMDPKGKPVIYPPRRNLVTKRDEEEKTSDAEENMDETAMIFCVSADTRRPYQEIGKKLQEDDLAVEELDFIKKMELVNTIGDIPNSKRRMEEIRTATKKDPVMIKLLKTIQTGWRDLKKETEKEIQPYFDVRAELTCEDGLILKGERIVIPMSERRKVMNNLHISHLGREGTLAKAREYVYWPKMNEEIKQIISVCDVCIRVRSQQQKEPLQLQEVPSRAWAVVSSDLFELNNRIYIIVVDHYSNFFEYELLSAATSGLVIRAMEQMFAKYGIPEKMITDNGTQYVSDEFKKFSREYGFDHSTTSPRFPQANGKAERAVGVCKQLMQKSLIAKSDFYVALLDFRNTPQAEIGLSPAQRMFGRRTRSLIPAVSKKFEQQQLPNVKQRIESSRAKQKQYFDEGSKELPELKVGDTVRMRLPGQKTWSRGTVVKKAGVRSFVVRVNGKNYRRNRRQVIPTPELPDEEQREDDDDGAEPLINEEPNQEDNNSPPRQAEPHVHRGGRVSTRERRPPNRYGDWVT